MPSKKSAAEAGKVLSLSETQTAQWDGLILHLVQNDEVCILLTAQQTRKLYVYLSGLYKD